VSTQTSQHMLSGKAQDVRVLLQQENLSILERASSRSNAAFWPSGLAMISGYPEVSAPFFRLFQGRGAQRVIFLLSLRHNKSRSCPHDPAQERNTSSEEVDVEHDARIYRTEGDILGNGTSGGLIHHLL